MICTSTRQAESVRLIAGRGYGLGAIRTFRRDELLQSAGRSYIAEIGRRTNVAALPVEFLAREPPLIDFKGD